ncbi:MAG: hypothetical protein JOY80_04405 [Candidatus Dormibacteraeota bacterium]|nr:hypothetical protein [Candidatus Dormibacteraeota bacterium]
MIPLDIASHGTRDQVGLLLRLALCEALSGHAEPVPILLDEPMLTADPRRRGTMLRFLTDLSSTYQVVLTAADPSLVDMLRGIAGDDEVHVVTLPGGEQAIETAGKRTRRARILPLAT